MPPPAGGSLFSTGLGSLACSPRSATCCPACDILQRHNTCLVTHHRNYRVRGADDAGGVYIVAGIYGRFFAAAAALLVLHRHNARRLLRVEFLRPSPTHGMPYVYATTCGDKTVFACVVLAVARAVNDACARRARYTNARSAAVLAATAYAQAAITIPIRAYRPLACFARS